MHKRIFLVLIFLSIAYSCWFTPQSYGWGFYAHKRINRMAVFTLPPELIGFYKKHIEYITEHAVDPDRRRYANPDEGARHFLDCDNYGAHPFDSIPKWWKNAVKKYGEDSLKKHGIVPWYIETMVYRLTEAFREMNTDRILYLSADLGHYVADAHVPLHTTRNYNGQFTNQKGIHAFWESRIPELYSEGYDYLVGRAKYVDKVIDKAWSVVKASHVEVDSVLGFEAELNKKFEADKKYSYETRGNALTQVYSADYTKAYDKMLDHMVERRMREAIFTVGSLWYTAWVNAGQPDLSRLEDKEISDSLKAAQKANEELWKTGKLVPQGHED